MTTTYRCTISDAGFDDLDVPISSLQIRLRQSPLQCYLSVQVPDILTYADGIDDRQAGEIAVYQDVDGTETEVLTANIDAVRLRLGPSNKTGEIVGYKIITFPGTGAHTLVDTLYRATGDGVYRYRAPPDPAIKPTDGLTVPDWEAVAVRDVSWNVNPSRATMEIVGEI